MHRVRTLAVAAIGALWASAAFAQAGASGAGWYLGGGIRPPTVADSDVGYRNFGGYRFTRHWGVELGYSDLGRSYEGLEPGLLAYQKPGSQPSAWTLTGTGVLPLGNAFSLQGRLGYSVTTPDASPSALGSALGSTFQAAGFGAGSPRYRPTVLWGFGGQYDLNSSVGLRLDYNNFGRVGDEQNSVRSDLWSINAVVRF
ncbi:MAG: outer membrane beta-barrel protein [Burkholderiales bacterium]